MKKWIKMKEKSFKHGEEIINKLQNELTAYIDNLLGEEKRNFKDKFIGLNVIEITNWLYSNDLFYEYINYSFIAKYYEKKLNFIKIIIIVITLLIIGITYLILNFGIVFIILCIIIGIISILILTKLNTGESYESYYNRTLLSFLMKIYDIEFTINNNNNLTDDEIKEIIYNSYDKKITNNSLNFKNNLLEGKISELELIKTFKQKDKNGNVKKYDKNIFDGFYLKINIKNNNNILRGNTIKIIADENIISSLAEDTVKGIYESQKEFSFNSEEMNKSFDCKISGFRGFNDIDDMMITVHKIITPSFEEHLLYLRERYNTFSLNINDSTIVATFNMKRNLLQKVKHNELIDFTTTYREANKNFRMLKGDILGIDDFAYYNIFPFLERLYLIKYLTYLCLSYTDFNNYYNLNNDSINSYEKSMKNIFEMRNKDFKEINTDKIKKIKNSTKEKIHEFENKEK